MTAKTSGEAYGATARPVEDVIKDLFGEIKPSNMPSIVWMIDITDEKTNQKIEGTHFQNEKLCLALKRFNCFKVDVRNLPDGDLKEQYLRQVGFYFFDPAGEPVLRPLTGKRAESLSTVAKTVEKVFDNAFEMRHDEYVKRMTEVLNGLDAVDIIDQQIQQVEKDGGPKNAREKRKLEQDVAERDEKKKAVEELENSILAECKLREGFLPEAVGDETGRKD